MSIHSGNLAGKPPLGLKDRDTPRRFSAEERAYFCWLREFPCCLSGRDDVQIAHTGGIEHGKGTSCKAPLWTCLPLSLPLHLAEEADRKGFWAGVGLDPIPWAERLWDIYGGDRSHAMALILDMQAAADRDFLRPILARYVGRRA